MKSPGITRSSPPVTDSTAAVNAEFCCSCIWADGWLFVCLPGDGTSYAKLSYAPLAGAGAWRYYTLEAALHSDRPATTTEPQQRDTSEY